MSIYIHRERESTSYNRGRKYHEQLIFHKLKAVGKLNVFKLLK